MAEGRNVLVFIFCWRQLCPSSRDGDELQFLTITADNAVLAPGERKLYLRAATKTVIRLLRAQVMALSNHNTQHVHLCLAFWFLLLHCHCVVVMWIIWSCGAMELRYSVEPVWQVTVSDVHLHWIVGKVASSVIIREVCCQDCQNMHVQPVIASTLQLSLLAHVHV